MALAIKNTPVLKSKEFERFNKLVAEQSSQKVTIRNVEQLRAYINKNSSNSSKK